MEDIYKDLQKNKCVQKQSYAKHEVKYKGRVLRYQNINNNHKISSKPARQDFNYSINSSTDLAKLFLDTYMAKFSAFDASCDTSALLQLMRHVKEQRFTNLSQSTVATRKVRNEWAHCNFDNWNERFFKDCFQDMRQLIRGIQSPHTQSVLDDLNQHEQNGKDESSECFQTYQCCNVN